MEAIYEITLNTLMATALTIQKKVSLNDELYRTISHNMGNITDSYIVSKDNKRFRQETSWELISEMALLISKFERIAKLGSSTEILIALEFAK